MTRKSILPEIDIVNVPEKLKINSHCNSLESYKKLYKHSIENPDEFWAKQAQETLFWQHAFSQVEHSNMEQGIVSWFIGGRLNVCENCVDRHVEDKGDQVALLWEGDEPGDNRSITYNELQMEVCRVANVFKRYGIRKGDRVAIYMPMIPEAAFAMLACARIGAIHTVVFAGFSAEALRDRILDSSCKAVRIYF